MGVEYRNYLLAQDRSFAPALDQLVTLVDRMRAERWVLTPGSPGWITPSRPHEMTGGWAEPFLERSTSPRERWQRAMPIPIPIDAGWLAALRQPASANPFADEVALHFYVVSGDDGESWKDLGLPYPLAYGEDESGYHDLFIYSSRDFVAGPEGDEVSCECGAALDYEVARGTLAPIDLVRRIRAVCEECSKPFAVEDEAGLAFRFAVVADFGKGWPLTRRKAERQPEDDPSSSRYDAQVLRSPYGDPAPPIAPAFLVLIEETFGQRFDSVPEFY